MNGISIENTQPNLHSATMEPMGKLSHLSSLFRMTDEQAMWRVQNNEDDAAFTCLVKRWEGPIVRLCARMTGDLHRGEDLKQEAFARVFARRKDFRPDAKFSTWLWRIALNLCYDELRRRECRPQTTAAFDPESEGTAPEAPSETLAPDAQMTATEDHGLVRQALLRLPETQRAALALRYCEGLKLREIAEILQVPETTASSRIAAGLAQITRLLEPDFSSLPTSTTRRL